MLLLRAPWAVLTWARALLVRSSPLVLREPPWAALLLRPVLVLASQRCADCRGELRGGVTRDEGGVWHCQQSPKPPWHSAEAVA